MKRVAMLLILILLLSPAAMADGLVALSDYFAACGPDAEWVQEVPGQLYSRELAPDVSVAVCARDGVVAAVSFTAPRDAENLVDLAWSAFGPADSAPRYELARAIEAGETQLQALGGSFLFTVFGGKRLGLYMDDVNAEDMFWLPMHGGVCRHLDPACSGMDVPRLVTAEVADALGFPACSKCAGGSVAERDLSDAA